MGGGLDLVVGHRPVDEAEPKGVLGPEHLPEEQDLEHRVGPELGDERRQLVRRLDEAEALHRDPEAARGAADPQVAHDRDPEPAAHAVALDEGDGRVAAGADRLQGGPEDAGVDPPAPLVHAPRRELADVRAGAERPPAGPAQDHAADLGVGVQLRHRVLEAEGDRDAERVPPGRSVDDDGRDRAVPRHPHLRGGLPAVLRPRRFRLGGRTGGRPAPGRFLRHRVLLRCRWAAGATRPALARALAPVDRRRGRPRRARWAALTRRPREGGRPRGERSRPRRRGPPRCPPRRRRRCR